MSVKIFHNNVEEDIDSFVLRMGLKKIPEILSLILNKLNDADMLTTYEVRELLEIPINDYDYEIVKR